MHSLVVIGREDCYRDALCALLEADFEVRASVCPLTDADRRWADAVVAELWDCDPFHAVETIREVSASCAVVALTRSTDPLHADELRDAGALAVVGNWASSEFLRHAIAEAAAGRCVIDPELCGAPGNGTSVLTALECDLLALIARGFTNKEIALALHRSVRSVEVHRADLIHKIGSGRRADLVRIAGTMGLTGPHHD